MIKIPEFKNFVGSEREKKMFGTTEASGTVILHTNHNIHQFTRLFWVGGVGPIPFTNLKNHDAMISVNDKSQTRSLKKMHN